jgi:hypothetical protein
MTSPGEHALSPSALTGLIRLRMMLERGLREAKDTSESGRHIALVTLDGACEYAIRFSAHHHALGLKSQADFHEGIREVRKLSRWQSSGPSGLRGVLELHAARNQTQHMGLLPDGELMSRWVLDAEVFIAQLVEVAFGVQLGQVLLADAIRDDQLRGLLSQGERELNAGHSPAAFRYADEALRQARLRWRAQRDYSRGYASVGLPTPADAEDQLEVQIFAADMTAYTQLLTTQRHVKTGGPEPDESEARSALLFAFDWIVQWEVFNEGYPVERYVEYLRTRSSPQLDDGGPPRIAWHIENFRLEVGAGREEEFELLLQLANIPVDDGRDWGLDFPVALASAEQELAASFQIGFHGIEPDGVLRVRVPVSVDPGDVVSVLNRATELATQSHERRDEDMREWRLHALELRERYANVLRETVSTGSVFGDVEVTPELHGTGVRYIVSVEMPSASVSDLYHATSIFSGQGGYLAGISQQAGKIVFEAFALEGDGLKRLCKAIQDSEEEVLRRRKIAAERERERQSFTQQIESLIGRVPTDTASTQMAGQDETV